MGSGKWFAVIFIPKKAKETLDVFVTIGTESANPIWNPKTILNKKDSYTKHKRRT